MHHETTFTMRSEVETATAITSVSIVSEAAQQPGSHKPGACESASSESASVGLVSRELVSREDLLRRIEELEAKNKSLSERGKQLALELDMFRQRKLVYWSDRFRNKFDAWHLMHPAFEELKDDTVIFQRDLKNFRLLPSVNLNRVNRLTYELDLGRPGLQAILLAPIVDMPSSAGEICLRITGGASQKVLREVSFPLAQVSEEVPCEFKFPSLEQASAEPLSIHIFVQNVDVPVRIFELRRYPLFGFAKIQRKLFCGFCF